MPESEASGTGPGTTEGRPCWLEDDVKRAIGAAQEAGLRAYRVEIAPDGTISLVVGVEPDPETTAPTA